MAFCCPRLGSASALPTQPRLERGSPFVVELDWIELTGGVFTMGGPIEEGYPEDGEGPPRKVTIDPYSISQTPILNREFAKFAIETGYLTDAERRGTSFVFHLLLSPRAKVNVRDVAQETPWWYLVEGAYWMKPEGPDSSICNRGNHPVTHISWNDALAYADWAGGALPTEAQWEFAARGGRQSLRYPWGNDLEPGGVHMCNVWQGRFPGLNTAADGFVGTSPAGSFPPNAFGLHDIVGNVWEWCRDDFSSDYHAVTQGHEPFFANGSNWKSQRGGSFLCHESYCSRYRTAARHANSADASASNTGFRIVKEKK